MPAVDVQFRIGGEAGQGLESSGAGFATALSRGGLHVLGIPSYYSRIRGGHNFFTIRVSDEPVYAVRESIELLLALNAETVARHLDSLVPGGGIVLDEGIALDESLLEGRDVRLFRLPLVQIAEKHGGAVMSNTAALAATAALVGFDLEPILSVIADNFGSKGEAVVAANRRVAEEAAAVARERFGDSFPWKVPAREAPRQMVIGANEAFALGALIGGCKFVAGYPMTPATSVLQYMAAHAAQWGLVVKHAEDEIAAVNMCVGAAHAGVRAMAPTSGGGFDLMTEGLSLAGMTETPLVIYLAQRPGPATGLATRTAQGDLFLALYASHGEYPRVLLAPHTPAEAFACGWRAFNIAEKYQCVVIVLSDQYSASAVCSVDPATMDPRRVQIERGKLLSLAEIEALESYRRYRLTADGISPRALPGMSPKAVYLASGNEHREDGHITEEPQIASAMLDKRLRKLTAASAEMRPPFRYGPKEAEITFLSWGSTYGPLYEAMTLLNAQGHRANLVHFVDLWPFPVEGARQALSTARRLIAVEGNATAQFASLLSAQTGLRVDEKILRYDGRGFTPEYILARVNPQAAEAAKGASDGNHPRL